MRRFRKFLKWTFLSIATVLVVGGAVLALVVSHDSPCAPVPEATGGARMKAYVYSCYGAPADVLHLAEIDKPVPKDDEVLVKVRAASVNPLDWHVVHGVPYVGRLGMGIGNSANLLNPQRFVLGGGVSKSGPPFWDSVRRTVPEVRSYIPE